MIRSLASVKDFNEASMISNYNFDIVDIKNINDGALGYAGDKEIKLIANKLNIKSLSVTAGNDTHPNIDVIYERAEFLNSLYIDYIKIGIFDIDHLEMHSIFLKKISHLNIKTVGVLFADNNLNIQDIKNLCKLSYDGLMIDTITKSSISTLDICNSDLIYSFISECHMANKFCGLSGSIKHKDIENAMRFKSDFIGFRGALCSSQTRDNIESTQCQNILSTIRNINQKMYQEAV
jgi:dihydroneopterin aldolase